LPAGAEGGWDCGAVSAAGAGTVCSAAGMACFSTIEELLWLAVYVRINDVSINNTAMPAVSFPKNVLAPEAPKTV